MKEWLRYQKKKVGIDHVHWNVIIKSKALENSYIKKAIKEGYLSVGIWPS